MRIDGIIFDKDGTLFGFSATWVSWARASLLRAGAGNSRRAAQLGAAIGFDYDAGCFADDSIVIAGTPDQIADALLPLMPGTEPSTLVALFNEEAERAPQAEAVPLVPVLGHLKERGLRLGLCTNDAEIPARAHLEVAGITRCFDFICGFDSGYGAKPAPGPLLAFARQFALDPERVVMVGDSLHDLRAGREAGMQTIGVLTGLAGEAELAPLADVILPDISHIAAWLDGL